MVLLVLNFNSSQQIITFSRSISPFLVVGNLQF